MRLIRSLCIAGLLPAAACFNSSDLPTSRPFGLISMVVHGPTAGAYTVSPTGVFFDQAGFSAPSLSSSAPDTCGATVYSPPSPETTPPNIRQLDPGDTIKVTTDRAIGFMTLDTLPNSVLAYALRGQDGARDSISYSPNTTLTFAVPGGPAGGASTFPAMTIDAKTANVFTLDPIDQAPPGDLTVTWHDPQGGDYAMGISLQYLSDAGKQNYDRQILCSFKDDGSGTIPAELASLWKNAPYPRRVQAFRWISSANFQQANAILAISEYDLEISYAVPAPGRVVLRGAAPAGATGLAASLIRPWSR